MAVAKNVVKWLVFLGGAALGTASLLVGGVKADSGTANADGPGEGMSQEGPTVLEALRDAADNDVVVAEYGVMPPPDPPLVPALYGPLPPDPGLDDFETLRDSADRPPPQRNLYGALPPWEIEKRDKEREEKRRAQEAKERKAKERREKRQGRANPKPPEPPQVPALYGPRPPERN